MWTKISRVYLALAIGAGMAASFPGSALTQISGERWQVTSVEGAAVPDPAKSRFEMQDDGTFVASVGCNAMRGKAEIQGSSLTIGPLAATRMACPEPLGSLETAFQRALQQAAAFHRDGEMLTLLDASGTVKVALLKAR